MFLNMHCLPARRFYAEYNSNKKFLGLNYNYEQAVDKTTSDRAHLRMT